LILRRSPYQNYPQHWSLSILIYRRGSDGPLLLFLASVILEPSFTPRRKLLSSL
jgi:hypothetical protein